MVDLDRIKELRGGDDSGSKEKEKSSKSKKEVKDKAATKKDKLQQYKNKKSTPSSSGGTDDIKILLFTLANMDAYTRVVIDYEVDGFNAAQTRIKKDFAKDVAGEITNFLGVFDVKEITSKYGYQWKNILEIAINSQDMSGGNMRTNSGDVDSNDIKELLECIANVMLFVEGTVIAKKDKDNKKMKDKAIAYIGDIMHDQFKKIVSGNEVQKIAERHGYDWEDDILGGVLENQDFGSKLEK